MKHTHSFGGRKYLLLFLFFLLPGLALSCRSAQGKQEITENKVPPTLTDFPKGVWRIVNASGQEVATCTFDGSHGTFRDNNSYAKGLYIWKANEKIISVYNAQGGKTPITIDPNSLPAEPDGPVSSFRATTTLPTMPSEGHYTFMFDKSLPKLKK